MSRVRSSDGGDIEVIGQQKTRYMSVYKCISAYVYSYVLH